MSTDQRPEQTVIRVVKHKKKHDEHHGGSWKVAYADFVTAMMAFFLVMWIMGMEQSVKDMVQGYFNNPIGFKKAQSAGKNFMSVANSPTNMNVERLILLSREQQEAEFQRVRDQIMTELEGDEDLSGLADQIEILITEEGLRIELHEDAGGETFFPVASATLKPSAARLIRVLAPELDALVNGVILEGHTDAVPYERRTYSNWDLSTDRAHAARRALETAGYRASKVLEVRGYADRHPRIPEDPYDPRNRRITMLLPYREITTPSVEVGGRAEHAGGTTTSHEGEE